MCCTQVIEYGPELELGSSNWKSEMSHVYCQYKLLFHRVIFTYDVLVSVSYSVL